MQSYIITKMPSMHKNELRANSTLINHANMVYELKARTIMINSGTESLKIQFEN